MVLGEICCDREINCVALTWFTHCCVKAVLNYGFPHQSLLSNMLIYKPLLDSRMALSQNYSSFGRKAKPVTYCSGVKNITFLRVVLNI